MKKKKNKDKLCKKHNWSKWWWVKIGNYRTRVCVNCGLIEKKKTKPKHKCNDERKSIKSELEYTNKLLSAILRFLIRKNG